MNLWRTLLETAIRIPSPHNVQPWRVRVINDWEADLFIDRRRTLPKEDPTTSFIILTMGMFIEGLKLLAANNNLDLKYELAHEPSWYAPAILDPGAEELLLPFARLRLAARSLEVESRYPDSLFLRRRTSRIALLP